MMFCVLNPNWELIKIYPNLPKNTKLANFLNILITKIEINLHNEKTEIETKSHFYKNEPTKNQD